MSTVSATKSRAISFLPLKTGCLLQVRQEWRQSRQLPHYFRFNNAGVTGYPVAVRRIAYRTKAFPLLEKEVERIPYFETVIWFHPFYRSM